MHDNSYYADSLHYRKMGNGPVIVLIHGFPESGILWRNIWQELATTNTLLIPDLPGSGKSALIGAVSISDMAERIKAMLLKEGIEKAVIAGHSMGGYVAFAFAAQFPEMVAGLSLVHSTPIADDEEKIASRKKAIEIFRNGGKDLFLRQMVSGLFAPSFKLTQKELVEEQVISACKMNAEALINFYTAMMERPDRVNSLKQGLFPVQWIIGEQDTAIPIQKILPYVAISKVNFVTKLAECGHMAMLEAPKLLTVDLKTFAEYCF